MLKKCTQSSRDVGFFVGRLYEAQQCKLKPVIDHCFKKGEQVTVECIDLLINGSLRVFSVKN